MTTKISNPVLAANEVHKMLGWTNPEDFTLDEIANALGIMIRDVSIEGSDGRILIDEDSAIMSINSSITYEPKRNFVIAHEIGHFTLHKNISQLFSDTDQTLSEWYQTGPQEQQANQFAAELLMPSVLFKEKLAKRKLNLNLIHEVSNYFKTSITATFLRYVTHGDFPLMVVFIENGIVKWKSVSTDFPFHYFKLGSEVPALTVAGDFFNKNQREDDPEKVDAIEWFPEEFWLHKNPDYQLWEQCYPISSTGFISCLWTS